VVAESARGIGLLAVTRRFIPQLSLGSAALCLIALATPGCATTAPDDDSVQVKLNEVDSRLTRIERIMSNQSLLDLSNQLEALRGEVRSMHNDIDVLNHKLEVNRKQQRDTSPGAAVGGSAVGGAVAGSAGTGSVPVVGADGAAGGVTATGAGAAGAASVGSASVAAAAAGGGDAAANSDEKAAYQAAFNLLKGGQYEDAVPAFQKVLQDYPNGQLADNSQYWLGEAYYVNKSYAEALAAFQRAVDKFPQSRKIPDALLKIGYCHYELKQWDSAKAVLQQVTTQYPDAPAAHLAQQRLDRMAAEKH
jgi:tol-pal system protein YbgF